MHAHRPAFAEFRDVLRSIAPLPGPRQRLVLQMELLGALERASQSRGRSRALEQELDRLRLQGLHELLEARRALARTKAEDARRIRAMRIEVLEMRAECLSLEEVCRSLLRTIERAAGVEVARASERTRPARASA